MPTQQLVEVPGDGFRFGPEGGSRVILGLDLGPGSRKVLFPLFLAAVSPFQRRVARSAARIFKNEAHILSATRRVYSSRILCSAASLAYTSAASLPALPLWPGTHFIVMVFPCSYSVLPSPIISIAMP